MKKLQNFVSGPWNSQNCFCVAVKNIWRLQIVHKKLLSLIDFYLNYFCKFYGTLKLFGYLLMDDVGKIVNLLNVWEMLIDVTGAVDAGKIWNSFRNYFIAFVQPLKKSFLSFLSLKNSWSFCGWKVSSFDCSPTIDSSFGIAYAIVNATINTTKIWKNRKIFWIFHNYTLFHAWHWPASDGLNAVNSSLVWHNGQWWLSLCIYIPFQLLALKL